MPSLHRVVVAVVAAALCAPATVHAGSTDLVSPDARYGEPQPPDMHASVAEAAAAARERVDLVSPDARDAASRPPHAIDLVSPDARDGMPAHTTVVPRAHIVEVPSTGFEWGDAAVGGGTTLALVLLIAGGAVVVRQGRLPVRSR
jgi:hypothetical protein